MNPKLKVPGIILALFLSMISASACFWITGTTYDGHSKSASGIGAARRLRGFMGIDHHKDGAEMAAALVNSTNFNERSDYAVSLAYLGKTPEAVDLLRTLERQHPGSYVVAANLGTALELMGNNREALHWIQEGIRRNPQSHDGTEWLHAKIIEAKIAQESDPGYFKSHSVLGLVPEEASRAITIDGQTFSPKEVGEAIQYQLQERLQFVKPPDAAVASLLFEYAAIEAATNILESAEGLLSMAQEYGCPADKVQAQIKLFDGKIAAARARRHVEYGLYGLTAIGVLVILYKGGIFVLSTKDLRKRNN